MLMIQRTANGEVTFAVSGRLDGASLGQFSEVLARERVGAAVTLELKELLLVDRDAVDFLRACEGRGVVLRNCPPYVRIWMARRGEQA